MKTALLKISTATALIAGLASASTARASFLTIGFIENAVAPISIGGDTVSYTGIAHSTITLNTDGTVGYAPINYVNWSYNFAATSAGLTLTPTLFIDPVAVGQTLGQSLTLTVTQHAAVGGLFGTPQYNDQTLLVGTSSPINFLFSQGGHDYSLLVKAFDSTLGATPVTAPAGDGIAAKEIVGGFSLTEVTPVPEMPTILSGLLLLVPFGAGAYRSIRKRA